MSTRRVSRRDLLSLMGLVSVPEPTAADEATGTVRPGAVFSLEAFYAERQRLAARGAPPPPAGPGEGEGPR